MLPADASMQNRGTHPTADAAVPDGLTEVRHHDGIYQWLNREQLARRERQRRGGRRDRKRWDLAMSAMALLLVFLIAGIFIQCRVREVHSLSVPAPRTPPPAELLDPTPQR